jgi:hypothetical protein
MTYWKKLWVAAAGGVFLGAALAMAQTAPKTPEPGKVIVSLYRVAPGKHLDFLKWMATREAISKEAGVGSVQWYVHTNGDSWDFVAIAPEPTKAQDAKVDELTRQKGLKTGFAAALAFSPVHCLPHRYVCRWSSVSGRSRQDGRAQSKRFN